MLWHVYIWRTQTSEWCQCYYVHVCNYENTTSLWICHTIVLDKDKKFYGVCCKALDLLKINCHVLLGDNHNPMLVECLCQYFNKGLTIMGNERDTVRVALERLLFILYDWNSCPVLGTYISHSFVAVGRKFAFPIDFSSGKHWQLRSSPATVERASALVARLLTYWSQKHVIGTGH